LNVLRVRYLEYASLGVVDHKDFAIAVSVPGILRVKIAV
jgi:hypothetical protein